MQLESKGRAGALIIASLVIGVSLIVCAVLIGSTAIKVKSLGQTISVTGAAYKPIVSDYATWTGYITVNALTLDEAYAKIKRDLKTVKTFLNEQNFTESDYNVSSIDIRKMRNREQEIKSYTLNQYISVEMPDVPRITQLAKDASTLIEKGVEFDSNRPSYIFTGLDELKIEMIKLATENARMRAEQLAESSGMGVGSPRSARVGVFQIRPLHSQAVSDYGINDISSIDKEIGCTVHISFLIK